MKSHFIWFSGETELNSAARIFAVLLVVGERVRVAGVQVVAAARGRGTDVEVVRDDGPQTVLLRLPVRLVLRGVDRRGRRVLGRCGKDRRAEDDGQDAHPDRDTGDRPGTRR